MVMETQNDAGESSGIGRVVDKIKSIDAGQVEAKAKTGVGKVLDWCNEHRLLTAVFIALAIGFIVGLLAK